MEMMSADSGTDRLAVVFGACVPKEFSAESVVPDTMPDIERILDAETAIYIRSKSIDDGEITLDGVINAVVLYSAAEKESVHKLSLSLPVSIECRDSAIQSGDILLADTLVASSEAKILNPRKILLRWETVSELRLLRKEPLELSCAGTEAPGLELLTKSDCVGWITNVAEKPFTIREEISLPDGAYMDDLLSYQVQVTAEDLKKVGSRAILQGTVLLSVLYTKESDGSPDREFFTLPYSQILETPAEEGAVSVLLRQSSCSLEPVPGLNGASSLDLEIFVNAQLVCTADREITYIADAYSLRGPCETDYRTVSVTGAYETSELRQTIRDRAEAPEGVKDVISVYPTASLPVVADGSVKLPVTLRILYSDKNDQLHHAVKRISAEIQAGDTDGTIYLASQIVFREVNASASGDGIDLRLETDYRFVRADRGEIRYVCSVTADDAAPITAGEGPSFFVIRPGDAAVWDLAKKYRSTCELIQEANPGGIVPDKLLLIPRARK